MRSEYTVYHIVRSFGLHGGMEKYVWRLTHELSKIGVNVGVICQEVQPKPVEDIELHVLPQVKSRHRWQSLRNFRDQVEAFIYQLQPLGQNIIFHSHERNISHHVTTFHGPPFQPKGLEKLLSRFSKRHSAWQEMERRELFGPNVRQITTVSKNLQNQLLNIYPNLETDSLKVTYPGVTPPSALLTTRSPSRFEILLFVGREWKRKGLLTAVEILRAMRKNHDASLDVFGPSILPNKIAMEPGVCLKGWGEKIAWENYDCLIHPATVEPFGMVVSEARAHGLPVLTSEAVGSIELEFCGLRANALSSTPAQWLASLEELQNEKFARSPEIKWTWEDLANQHISDIYSIVNRKLLRDRVSTEATTLENKPLRN